MTSPRNQSATRQQQADDSSVGSTPATIGRFSFEIDVQVRLAVEDDLPALEWMGLYAAHRRTLHRAFEAQQRGTASLLLGVTSSFPVAQVFIDYARPTLKGDAMLWAVRTFFPLQGRGIGTRMMEVAEETIRRRGVRRARLTVERDNERALRFYQRLGWRQVGQDIERFTVGEDGAAASLVTLHVYVMEKELAPVS